MFRRSFARLSQERSGGGFKDALVIDSKASFALLLKQCGASKSLEQGRRLHSRAIALGCDSDTILGNLIVQMYGKCGCVEEAMSAFARIRHKNPFSYSNMISCFSHSGRVREAKFMFDSLAVRDVITWNTMITAFAQNGQHSEAFACFQLMDLSGVFPNAYTFVAVLSTCTSLAACGALHAFVVDCGLEADERIGSCLVGIYGRLGGLDRARAVFNRMQCPDVVLWTKLLVAYAKNGHLLQARLIFEGMPEKDAVAWTAIFFAYAHGGKWIEAKELFDRMPDRDLLAWNCMISAYAQNGKCRGALELFSLMDLDGLQPNRITLLTVFDACTALKALEHGKMIHGSCNSELLSSVAVNNALINMYGRCNRVEDAKAVFDSLCKPDEISWTCMVSAYAQSGQLERARSLLDQITDVNQMARDAMVVAYAQSGHLQEARDMLESMKQPLVSGWTALVSAYAEAGFGRDAFNLFAAGDLEGLQADVVSFVGIVNACTCSLLVTEGSIIYAEALERDFHLDIVLGTALVTMFGKFGQLGLARDVFDAMPCKNFITWNAMITGYSQNGQTEALELFPYMSLEGSQPTRATFLNILSLCGHKGLLEAGLEHFGALQRDHQLEPTREHFVCMIDLLGRAGRLDSAEELVREMPFEAHGIAWMSLLGCCTLHGDSARAAALLL